MIPVSASYGSPISRNPDARADPDCRAGDRQTVLVVMPEKTRLNDPGVGFILDNSEQSPDETAREILRRVQTENL